MPTLLLALATGVSAAGDFYAKVAELSGPVQVKALGHQAFTRAEKGSSLIPGDLVKTGPGGVAHLEFDGGAMLLVTGNSSVVLGGVEEEPEIRFAFGEWLLGLAKKLQAGRRFRVHTPQAVAAVRGTLFWGKTDPKETQLAGLENEVEVGAMGKTVVLKPGQLVVVPSGAPPRDPVPHSVPAPFLDRFKVDGKLGGLDSLLAPKAPRAKQIKKAR